jgi:ATP-dependent helicase HrpB
MPARPELPVDDVLPALVDALRTHSSVVLRAPAGAGKTTRVPPALLDSGIAAQGNIFVLQPRRFAARATARRMAVERAEEPGGTIGYQVRFERKIGRETRIHVMTEGVLLRKLLDDPFLEEAAVLVFDEFHERSLESDLALGMARRVQETVRPEFKIVVMSATLAAAPIAAYLHDCPIVECEGRMFPLEIEYAERVERRSAAELAASGVEQILGATRGDILAFLPGAGEIRQAAKLLEDAAQRGDLAVMPLYGDLPPEQQDAVLAPIGRRKVVLATNVAETSVTIEGVTGVVDTGVAKVLWYDPSIGLDRLELRPISRASADQRAGRAGRTQPGVCLRMWPQALERSRPEFEEPEIRRVDLSGPVLKLRCWDEPNVLAFPWFESPRREAVERAASLLRLLGAIDERGVTEIGRKLARLPVSPRLGRMLLEGRRRGVAKQAATAAALLSQRDPFVRSDVGKAKATHVSSSDLLDRVLAIEEYEQDGRSAHREIHRGGARTLLRTRDQLLRELQSAGDPMDRGDQDSSDENEAILRTVLAAFPDRVAKRREANSTRGVMVGGRGVRLAPISAVQDAELFVCVDVQDAGAEALVRVASRIEREWLPRQFLQDKVSVEFDEAQERLLARRRLMWHDLVLEESPAAIASDESSAAILARRATERFERVFPFDEPEVGGFVQRVRFLRQWAPELELPLLDDEQLRQLLPALCFGRRSFAEVRSAPWLASIQSLFTWDQLQMIELEAPERLRLPTGRMAPLQYEGGKPPILAARVQELFGWRETPRIARGRVRILLHILAPNYRVQQVTDDVASFWRNTYPKVRKDLRGRYPKHAWPEDPN